MKNALIISCLALICFVNTGCYSGRTACCTGSSYGYGYRNYHTPRYNNSNFGHYYGNGYGNGYGQQGKVFIPYPSDPSHPNGIYPQHHYQQGQRFVPGNSNNGNRGHYRN